MYQLCTILFEGVQETVLKCKTKESTKDVPDDYCLEAPRVQTERRVCNDRPCPQRYSRHGLRELC